MKHLRHLFSILLAAALLSLPLTTASAVSLDDPAFTVRVCFPPRGLTLSLQFEESMGQEPIPAEADNRLGESCYRFFYRGVPMSWKSGLPEGTRLVAETPKDGVICRLPAESLTGFQSIYTLDLERQAISEGYPVWRTPLLVGIRVAVTLALQVLALFLLGYRARRSWLIFAAVLLFNHIFLNAGVIVGASTLLTSYVGWALAASILAELFLFVIECAVFSLLLLERRERRAVLASALVNFTFPAVCAVFVFFLPM